MSRNFNLITALRLGKEPETGFMWRINSMGEVSTSDEIIGTSASISFPTSEVEFFVASTNANDTASGSGAQEVEIVYLDGDYNTQTTTVELDGQTPVSIDNALRIQSVTVTRDGVTSDFDGSNAAPTGTIHVGRGAFTSGVPATPYINVQPGYGKSSVAVFTVPAGHSAFLTSATISAPSADDFEFTNWISVNGGPWLLGGLITSTDTTSHLSDIMSQAAPEKTDIQIRGKSQTGSADVSIIADFVVIRT